MPPSSSSTGVRVSSGRPRDDLADEGAPGEEDEVVWQFQELGVRPLATGHGGDCRRVEILRHQLQQNGGRRRQRFAQGEDAGVAGGQRRQRRTDWQQRTVERANDQRDPVGFAINHPFVAILGQELGHRRFLRLHPRFELHLRTSTARRRLGLEDVFLGGGLEVFGHRLLEAGPVLADHAGHAVELAHPPLVGAGDARGEQRLLRVEDVLELVHLISSSIRLIGRSP